MKQLLLILVFLFLLSFAAPAQVKVGVKAGATRYSEVYRNTLYGDFKYYDYLIFAAVFTTIPLTEQVYVRA